MKLTRCFCAAALVAVICGLARAGEFEPGAMELYPTYSAIGIEIPYTGDEAGEVTPEFVWRKTGQTQWRNGVEMTVEREKHFIWASIWPLEQGDSVEVKVTFTAGETEAAPPLEGTVSVREMVLSGEGGRFWVSPDGNDENPGSQDQPWRTLAHAASVVKAGDTVFACGGVYREGGLFSGLHGEPGNPIVFTAAEGEKPVIDGSDTIEKGSGAWRDLGNGVFATDLALNAGQARYAAQDGLRMFYYRSLAELEEDELHAGRAWFYDEEAGEMYVRTGDERAPAEHTYNIANFTYGVDLTGSEYVVVRGFEIRFCGEACIGVTDPSRGCIIYENTLHSAPGGVNISGYNIHDTAVWRNRIYDRGLADFTWHAIKASGYRRQGITCFSGRGSSICHNFVDGYFDCIDPEVWRLTDRLDLNRDLDVMYNDLLNSGDDAIEADGGGVNYRIHGNRIRNCFAAISIAPVEKGPLYVTRNDASYKMLFFKLNVGGPESRGWAYCYHNSGYCQVAGRVYGGVAVSLPPARTLLVTNKRFANNACIAKDLGIRYGNDLCMFDYDCFHNVPGTPPLVFTWQVRDDDGRWRTLPVFPTLEAFSEATGHETHGIYADPMFVATPDLGTVADWRNFETTPIGAYPLAADMSVGDMHLKPGSPCIDAGVVIRGINEDYRGDAPDIGAFETGGR